MKMRTFMSRLALTGIMILGMSIFAGCGDGSTQTASLAERGTLLLRVNPEIAVEYDGNGKVTSVQGRNEDGKDIVEGYQDYIGKECREVVSDLVKEIQKAGYFVEEIEGRSRTITIELETGSILPEQDFLDQIAADVQQYVADMQMNSPVVVGADNRETTIYDISDYGASAYEAEVPAEKTDSSAQKPGAADASAPPSAPKPGTADQGTNQAPAASSSSKPGKAGQGESPYTPYGASAYEESPYTPYEASAYEESPYTPYEASAYEESPYTPYEASAYEESPYTPYEASNYETSSYSNYETSGYSDYE